MLRQLVLVYAGCGGLTLFGLLTAGPMGAEVAALLLLFCVVASLITDIIKNSSWF